MKEMHSRDSTILIISVFRLLANVFYIIVYYSSLFQYFFIDLLSSLL